MVILMWTTIINPAPPAPRTAIGTWRACSASGKKRNTMVRMVPVCVCVHQVLFCFSSKQLSDLNAVLPNLPVDPTNFLLFFFFSNTRRLYFSNCNCALLLFSNGDCMPASTFFCCHEFERCRGHLCRFCMVECRQDQKEPKTRTNLPKL